VLRLFISNLKCCTGIFRHTNPTKLIRNLYKGGPANACWGRLQLFDSFTHLLHLNASSYFGTFLARSDASSLFLSLFPSLFIDHHHQRACPLYSGFPSPKTKFRHLSLSLVSSSVGPRFVMHRLTPSIHLSLGLPLLRVPSGSHSTIFRGSLFPGILSTCPNHRSRFSSILKCSSPPPWSL
jgi:hypothetical protein